MVEQINKTQPNQNKQTNILKYKYVDDTKVNYGVVCKFSTLLTEITPYEKTFLWRPLYKTGAFLHFSHLQITKGRGKWHH